MKKRLITTLFAALMLVFMMSAAEIFAAEDGEIEYLNISWMESGDEIIGSYKPDTDSFKFTKWDEEAYASVELDTQFPAGVSYDSTTGTVTLENAAIEDIFYRGTKDLKIHVVGNSSLDMIKVDDGRAGIKDPETGYWTDEYVCYHGGDIVVYGDGKNQSSLDFDWIWQITTVGSMERLEPDADDGDVIIKDITLSGTLIESAISNLTFESCDVKLQGRTDSEGDFNCAAINTGGSPEEYANPEGFLTVKDSVIELTGEDAYMTFLEYDLNGENLYLGNGRPETAFDFENNYYKKNEGYYYTGRRSCILITPETIKLPESLHDKAEITMSQDSFTYTGKEIKPQITVTYNGKVLKEGVDYTVSYRDNVEVGEATVYANGINNYRSYAWKRFNIVKAPAPKPASPAPGTTAAAGGATVTVLTSANGSAAGTVAFTKAPNKKTVTVPATVVISGKTFNVTSIAANAFKGTKATKVIVKTKLLTKASVKKCLKGSKVKTVQVKVGSKKLNKKFAKKYKKFFTKGNTGKKAKVK